MRRFDRIDWVEFGKILVLAFLLNCALWFIMALLSQELKAEDITLTWTNPDRTFNMTDAGPYTNPAGTKIYLEVADTADPNLETVVIPNMKPGTYRFVAVSYDDQGVASPVSGEAEKTVASWTTISDKVRIVARTEGSFILPVVGTVALGATCNLDVAITGPVFDTDGVTIITKTFYALDPADVTFTGVEDILVLGECG